MKILVVCQYYYPEQFRINDISEQLVKDGHLVTVLTGLPNYPMGVIPKDYRFGKKRKEVINGVNVIRCFEISRNKSVVGMALNYASYMVSASFKALFLKKDFDLVFVYQLSPVSMALPGIIMKMRCKKPLYLYCCDIWPESMKNLLPNEKTILFKAVKKFSNFIYSKCDKITVSSKRFIEYLTKEHSIPVDRVSYIPQHAEDKYLNIETKKTNKTINFVFMGNMGIAQDIVCILDATERIKDMGNFKVHFVGDGVCLDKSRAVVREKGLDDIVFFHGYHPVEKMPYFYDMADACLLTLKADNLIGVTMPSKLLGYMAAGKTVIGAINGAGKEVICESDCGLCVDASDSKALAEAMKDFIENPVKFSKCGENGRQYFKKHFTKDIYMEKLMKEFDRLMEV